MKKKIGLIQYVVSLKIMMASRFLVILGVIQDEGFELYYSGKEGLDRINSIPLHAKTLLLFHVKAVETKIKTQ